MIERITDEDVPMGFIASPLFNPPQIAIIERIEDMLTSAGFRFYSARLDSGSDKLSPEEKRVLKNWDPVFESNVYGLNECSFIISVFEYALPPDTVLTLVHKTLKFVNPMNREYSPEYTLYGKVKTELELPDAGTVWEIGYIAGLNYSLFSAELARPIIGFHSTKQASHLNLMLTHGVQGLVCGWDNLQQFLTNPGDSPERRDHETVRRLYHSGYDPDICWSFDWTACSGWANDVE